ncbi:MAG: hypothetical protein AAFO15_00605 [Pseudomonadota bacterium]
MIIIITYIIILFTSHYLLKNIPNIQKYLLFATIFTSTIGGGTIIGLPAKIQESQDISITIALIISEIIPIIFTYIYTHKIIKFSQYLEIFKHYNQAIIKTSSLLLTCGYCAIQIYIIHDSLVYILNISKIQALIITIFAYLILMITFTNNTTINTNLAQFLTITISIPIITYYILINFISNNNIITSIDHLSSTALLSNSNLSNIYSSITTLKISYNTYDISKYFLIFSLTYLNPTLIKNIIITTNNNPSSHLISNIQKNTIIKSIFYIICITLLTLQGVLFNTQNWLEGLSYILPANIYYILLISIIAAATSTLAIDMLIIKDTFNTNTPQNIIYNLICGIIIFTIAYTADNPINIAISMTVTWAPITLFPMLFQLHNITFKNYIFLINTFVIILYLILNKYINISISSPTFTSILISGIIYFSAFISKQYTIKN